MGTGFALCLKERPNFDCVFWTEAGCSVYEARPVQCSTYPFWSTLVETEGSWREEARDCPGIGRGGLLSREEIEERLWRRRSEATIILEPGAAATAEDIDETALLGS